MNIHKTVYGLEDTVFLDNGVVEAVITGVLIRNGGHSVMYELTYMDGLNLRSEWFIQSMVDRLMYPTSDNPDTTKENNGKS